MKNQLTKLALLILLTGCAHTNIYSPAGQLIAHMEGDMSNVKFREHPNGTVEFSATSVNHSTATLAQGEAAANKISTIGSAIAATGVVTLLK